MSGKDSARYVVAVSGGVDSVVLLHKFRQKVESSQLVVAHFDHGIRPKSDADARFVEGLAKLHGIEFETRREELGGDASEALARERRYDFLLKVAKKHNAKLVTAHHADDMVETIAINIVRGTGWRGLTVMSDTRIYRPLLNLTKGQILNYALENRLEWVDDETNSSNAYLRNIIRRLTAPGDVQAARLSNLRSRQMLIRNQIEAEVTRILKGNPSRRRYFMTQIDSAAADELLRQLLIELTGTPLTRPQRTRMLMGIKVGQPGSRIELGEGVVMLLESGEFEVDITKLE